MILGQRINQARTPESRFADTVCEYFAHRPHLIERLLHCFGATRIRMMGTEIRSTCPIHHGNNPEAFVIWTDMGSPIWKCYTDCHESGTIIRLVMRKYPRASFVQAIHWAAQFAGLAFDAAGIQVSRRCLDEESDQMFKRQMGIGTTRDDTLNVFPEDMVVQSSSMLYSHPGAQLARDWLTGNANEATHFGDRKKQIPWQVVQHFNVGWVPGRLWVWYDQSQQREFGWFEDRVSIPWRSLDGKCCGFSGRRIDGSKERKYKNLPGTSRGIMLFGLSDPFCVQEIRRTKVLHAFEGYTDVFRAFQHRCYNSCALGGTDFTRQQLELIASIGVEKTILCFDGDLPGITAANKYAKQLMKITQVDLAVYPPGTDPGDQIDEQSFWSPILGCQRFIPKE